MLYCNYSFTSYVDDDDDDHHHPHHHIGNKEQKAVNKLPQKDPG